MPAEQHVSARRRGQLPVLPACCACGTRVAVVHDAQRDATSLTTTRNPGNVCCAANRVRRLPIQIAALQLRSRPSHCIAVRPLDTRRFYEGILPLRLRRFGRGP
jgi:hypothetical protein